ncbi:hypothetical protein A2U01_0098019, partial [Trifolium medium]|nr:hypothetical protein [Trifolium medium]
CPHGASASVHEHGLYAARMTPARPWISLVHLPYNAMERESNTWKKRMGV